MNKHALPDSEQHTLIMRRASVALQFLVNVVRREMPTDNELRWFHERNTFIEHRVNCLSVFSERRDFTFLYAHRGRLCFLVLLCCACSLKSDSFYERLEKVLSGRFVNVGKRHLSVMNALLIEINK